MQFEGDSKKSVSEHLVPLKSAFIRFWRVVWAPALAVLALGLLGSYSVDDYYESDATIYIEPQKVETDILKERNKFAQQEKFEAIVQEILSRPNLRAVVDRFDPYPQHQGVIGKEIALIRLRSQIRVQPIVSTAGQELAYSFRVSYQHSDPNMAYQVIKTLSNLLIEKSEVKENDRMRGSLDFFESQLRDVSRTLKQTEASVKEYIMRHGEWLPENREQAIARMQSKQQQLGTNSTLLQESLSRMSSLEREYQLAVKQARGSAAAGGDGVAENPYASLGQLEKALAVLKTRYSAVHPDVVNTKRRIQALRKQIASEQANLAPGKKAVPSFVAADPELRNLRRSIDEQKIRINTLTVENEALKKSIVELDENIKQIPQREQELLEIRRDYDAAQERYTELLRERDRAATREQLVKTRRSSKFVEIDPPRKPLLPSGPNRKFLVGGSFVGFIGVLLGLPLVFYALNGSFKFREDIEAEVGVPVIGVLPPMKTPASKLAYRRASFISVACSALTLCCGSLVIVLIF
jgi:polysaccharide chain length determinant protein (PEP-CTERM system associated)